MKEIIRFMLLAVLVITMQQSLFAYNLFSTPKKKDRVYVLNMYGEDISLEFVWRAKSTLGGFDRTREKILKGYNTSYQEYAAPFSEYRLYKLDAAPAKNIIQGPIYMNDEFYNYTSRYSNNDSVEVDARDHYFIIEPSRQESAVPGQSQIVIRDFADKKEADQYLQKFFVKQKAFDNIKKLDQGFMEHYYGPDYNKANTSFDQFSDQMMYQ